MDKQEFNVKIDRLKRAVDEKDYTTALKIVQGIDWNRVKSPSLLGLASSVYEQNDRLEEAKDILVIALERSSNGKRILYKLTELAVRSGNLEEAEEFYQEYRTVASSDPACLLLEYMLNKVKHAPYSQLIKCLELYNEYEPDEKWMYELATTYEAAGRIQDAVGLCDRIALMFGTSPYGVKALKLKQKYVKLTDEQRAALYPNSIASAGEHYAKGEPRYEIRTTERAEEPEPAPQSLGDQLAASRMPDEDLAFEAYLLEHDPLKDQNVPEETPIVPEEVIRNAEGPVAVEREPEPEVPAAEEEAEPEKEPEEDRTPIPVGTLSEKAAAAEAEAKAEAKAEAEAEVKAEAPEITEETVIRTPVVPEDLPSNTDPEAEILQVDAAISDAKLAAAAGAFPAGAPQPQARTTFTVSRPAEPEEEPAPAEPVKEPAPAPAEPVKEPVPAEEPKKPAPAPVIPEKKSAPAEPEAPRFVPGLHLIIEALDEEEGVEIARKELAVIYRLRGENRKVAKADAEKLNRLSDMGAVEEKIGDRDLVISAAGDLTGPVADQLYAILEDRESLRSIVFVDTPEGLDMLEETLPDLFDICDILVDEDAREKDYSAYLEEEKDRLGEGAGSSAPEAPAREEAPEERPVTEVRKPETTKKNDLLSQSGSVPFHMPESDDEILEFEDFAQYCIHYANGMGCSISGKTLLALYEKIEILEEDGIALTRIAAEDCVEEAADHAEHPGMKGLFRKKYDKDDMLILREEDFIN